MNDAATSIGTGVSVRDIIESFNPAHSAQDLLGAMDPTYTENFDWWTSTPERRRFAETLSTFTQGGIYREVEQSADGRRTARWIEGAALLLDGTALSLSDFCVFRYDREHCDTVTRLKQKSVLPMWDQNNDGDLGRATSCLKGVLATLRNLHNRPSAYTQTLHLGLSDENEDEADASLLVLLLGHHHTRLGNPQMRKRLGNPRMQEKSLFPEGGIIATSAIDILSEFAAGVFVDEASLRMRNTLWDDLSGIPTLSAINSRSSDASPPTQLTAHQTIPTVVGAFPREKEIYVLVGVHDPEEITETGSGGGLSWWKMQADGEGDYNDIGLSLPQDLRVAMESEVSQMLVKARGRVEA